jgi:hypothetical protein
MSARKTQEYPARPQAYRFGHTDRRKRRSPKWENRRTRQPSRLRLGWRRERSCSSVGSPSRSSTASQKKLLFNLRRAKSQISALDEGDLRPDQVKKIAKSLGVSEQDVVDMNRRMAGDASLNSPLRDKGEGEWQDWLVDDAVSQENALASARKQATASMRCRMRWAS